MATTEHNDDLFRVLGDAMPPTGKIASKKAHMVKDDELFGIDLGKKDGPFVAHRYTMQRHDASLPTKAPLRDRLRTAITCTALLAVAAFIAVVLLHRSCKPAPEPVEEGLFDSVPAAVPVDTLRPLGTVGDTVAYAEKLDTVINDVVLTIYLPHHSTPTLTVGVPDRQDRSIILAAQAADIRKDNRQILGSFVLNGEPLAWGSSKKGYCAILDGKVQVGVSEDTPLFERATETGGCFFRQYPLVDCGRLVESELKNKTMRKALCERAGQVFMVVSQTPESMHDFAQALVDLGVYNAIYLVGSYSAFGWYVDRDGRKTTFSADVHYRHYSNENYIIWKSN